MTDSVMLMGENKYLTTRYYDIIHPKPEEKRTAEEVISSIFSKLEGGEE